MEHKIFYRLTVAILTICLITGTLDRPAIKSHAFSPIALPVAWEVLQALLLSAGVSMLGYEQYRRVREAGSYRRSYEAQVKALNGLDEGLGDALDAAVSGTAVTDGSYRVELDEASWRRLLALSGALAASEGIMTMAVDLPASLGSMEAAVEEAVMAIPGSRLPIGREGGRVRGAGVAEGIVAGFDWDAFMERAVAVTGMQDPYITAIYTTQESASGASSWSGIIYVYTAVPVHGMRDHGDHGGIVLFDAAGDDIPFGCATFNWYNSSEVWAPIYWGPGMSTILPYGSQGFVCHGTGTTACPIYAEVLFKNGLVSTTVPAAVGDAFRAQLEAGTYDVVTPGRFLTDVGALAGGIAISIPTTFPLADELGKVIADTVPATDVLPKIGVTPVDIADDKVIGKDMTITDAMEDAKAPAVPAAPPAVGGFDLGLADFFPFCIPFDFASFIGAFKAEPEAPSFRFRFPVGKDGSEIKYEEYTVSLEQFDEVAYWCRKLELLAFIVGLMLATRSMFIRS